MNEELKQKFEAACDALHAAGYNVVAVVAHYTQKTAEFSTRVAVSAVPEAGVTENHVVLDSIREISSEWSRLQHRTK